MPREVKAPTRPQAATDLLRLCRVLDLEGAHAGVREAALRALPILREAGDRKGEYGALHELARASARLRRPEEARAYLVQALALQLPEDPLTARAVPFTEFVLALGADRDDLAEVALGRLHEVGVRLGNDQVRAESLFQLGHLRLRQGDRWGAAQLFGACLEGVRGRGYREAEARILRGLRDASRAPRGRGSVGPRGRA